VSSRACPAIRAGWRFGFVDSLRDHQLGRLKILPHQKKTQYFVTISPISDQMHMNHEVKIVDKQPLNHDVIRFRLERPAGYEFVAGQATEVSISTPEPKGPSPFTFTGLNTQPYLELTIKIYKAHKGLTAVLASLNVGDKLTITDPWDSFRNNGPGVFIAGGAGITPFIALLRQMQVDGNIASSWLFFSNKTTEDVFLADELRAMLGDHYVDVITRDENGRERQHIDEALLTKYVSDFSQPSYVCGPPGFVDIMQETLKKLGAAEQMVNVSL
jgi:ferredoxin-NADP reductase